MTPAWVPTAADTLVVSLAREVPDGATVLVAPGAPLLTLALAVAAATHAPRVVPLWPNGATGVDLRFWHGAAERPGWRGDAGSGTPLDVLDWLRQGRVQLALLEVETVDARGRVGTTAGPGALPSMRALAGRTVLLAARHDGATLVERVVEPVSETDRPGLLHTPLGVLELGPAGATLVRRHSMTSTEALRERTGFAWESAPRIATTASPGPEHLEVLRRLDPENRRETWTTDAPRP